MFSVDLYLLLNNDNKEDLSQVDLMDPRDKYAVKELLQGRLASKYISDGTKILLTIKRTLENECRLFKMFPEVLMFDVTTATNNEERSLSVDARINQLWTAS